MSDVPSNENETGLSTPAQFLPGAGPERAVLLERLNLHTAQDVLFNMPRDVLDLTDVRLVQNLEADVVQSVLGSVVDRDSRSLSQGRTMTGILLDCDGQYLRGVWFNQPWMLRKYADGQLLLFSGKPKRRGGRWEMSNPRVQPIEEAGGIVGEVLPVYRLTDGLKADQLRRIQHAVAEKFADEVPDPLPEDFRKENRLPFLPDAIRQLHRPDSKVHFEHARRRLVFDDLFEFQTGLALRKRLWSVEKHAAALPTTSQIDARIRRLFPFEFTNGQNQAVKDIAADMATGKAMHRLLQADVGAGKTAVAVYALLVAIAAGYQAVLMGPTEVLVRQHWQTINEILAQSRVRRLCLTGSLKASQRRDALSAIREGEVDLVIGTQAVIQDGVTFNKLGLAVIDEQHKFGVMQRARLTSGVTRPHLLVMTATPIPRSLCLTVFGDLDVSVMKDLPPGRQKIVTSRIPTPNERAKVFDFVRKKLSEGRQAYVVCPRVVESDDPREADKISSAEAVFEDLRTGEFRDFNVSLVHGQMDREERNARMQAFRDGDVQVLVSTTVIEVGVDVPNSTIMIICEAERFGLSQLHQLRGRIGRGRFQGYCFLFSDAESVEANARLGAMEEHTDGFRIAEVDFEIRGPGDVLGVRQSGQLPLRVASLVRDAELLAETREVAFELVQSGKVDEPQFRPLKAIVIRRFGRLLDLPESG
ncbi:MAG: ATP-dependent DNA helicase RecG [Planctomycetaceae bacterium]